MNELVSVIIRRDPSQKAATIPAQLKQQTYPHFEGLLLCPKEERKRQTPLVEDPRFCKVETENKSGGQAKNDGIRFARGKYLLFLQEGDWIHKTFLEKLMNSCAGWGAKLSGCRFLPRDNTEKMIGEDVITLSSGEETLATLFSESPALLNRAGGKLYHKDLFCGLLFPEDKEREEEWVVPRLILKAKSAAFHSARLYQPDKKDDPLSFRQKSLAHIEEALEVLIKRAFYLQSQGLPDLAARTEQVFFSRLVAIDDQLLKGNDKPRQEAWQKKREVFRSRAADFSSGKIGRLFTSVYFSFPRVVGRVYGRQSRGENGFE